MTARLEVPAGELAFGREWVWAEILAIAARVVKTEEGRHWLARARVPSGKGVPEQERVEAVTGYAWLVLHDPENQRARAVRGHAACPADLDAAVRMVLEAMRTDREREHYRRELQAQHKLGEVVAGWRYTPLPPDSDLLDLLRDLSRQPAARPTPAPAPEPATT